MYIILVRQRSMNMTELEKNEGKGKISRNPTQKLCRIL